MYKSLHHFAWASGMMMRWVGWAAAEPARCASTAAGGMGEQAQDTAEGTAPRGEEAQGDMSEDMTQYRIKVATEKGY